jgi:hypothetical protein
MASARLRAKEDPQAMAAEKAAARANRRQELARIIAEKQQQMTRVRTAQAGRDGDAISVSSSTTAEDPVPSSRLFRNKENEQPALGLQSKRPPSKSSSATRQQVGAAVRQTSKEKAPPALRRPSNGEVQSALRRPSRDEAQTASRRPSGHEVQKKVVIKEESAPSKKASSIEELYSFDLARVEENVTKEASSDMEQMYSFDLSKVQGALANDVEGDQVAAAAPDAQLASTAEAQPPLSARGRRKSAPIRPQDADDRHSPAATPQQHLGESWQEAGLRKLAAENRELKERAAKLEYEYQRLQHLANSVPNPPAVEATQFAEMD